jgi:hypothetical protein
MNIFQDESGCLGFEAGSSKYFIVALLCPEDSKLLGHIVRKFKGNLISKGWPKTKEIKATHLHMAKYDPQVPDAYQFKNDPDRPITDILNKISKTNIEIDAIVVNKKNIEPRLRTLPYGVLYNYFSRNVLVKRTIQYDESFLYIDRTSKQSHKIKHFDDYIYTEALLAKGENFKFSIAHVDSNVVAGICAVDFLSWGLSRLYEFKDDRFMNYSNTESLICYPGFLSNKKTA